jgi:hypothetical protein
VSADMYLYVSGGNSMTQCIPAQFHVGGKLLANLTDAPVRPKVAEAMRQYPSPTENLCQVAGARARDLGGHPNPATTLPLSTDPTSACGCLR